MYKISLINIFIWKKITLNIIWYQSKYYIRNIARFREQKSATENIGYLISCQVLYGLYDTGWPSLGYVSDFSNCIEWTPEET